MSLYTLTATEAISKIKQGEITIRELVDAFIRRIEATEPKVHAWKFFSRDLIQQQMVEILAYQERGLPMGRLCGIPIGVKDIFNTRDMPTTMGSPIWEGFTPGNDARVVYQIRMEGGLVMGKTVTAEFAVHYPGPTLHPYDSSLYPGTSSTGSAVAVAAAMVPLALGTQTAGSIIRPASYTGVYGYKPSFGLLPRIGILKTVDPLDHVGFFTRSVDDLRLMLDALRVRGPNYPFVHKYIDRPNPLQLPERRVWQVAFVKTHTWDFAAPYAKAALTEYVNKVASVPDISVSEVELPAEFANAHSIHATIYERALAYYFKDEYSHYPDKISRIFMDMVERGNAIPLASYQNAIENQAKLSQLLDAFFDQYDIIFSLATSGEPPLMSAYEVKLPDPSLIWTLCKAPSINLPIFTGPRGVPFGIQTVARRYNDYGLLAFLKSLENIGLLGTARIVMDVP